MVASAENRLSKRGVDEEAAGSAMIPGLSEKKLSRTKFLGLGLSAAIVSSGISPFIAKAQTVNFGAATVGKLSDYCRGDGTDETAQINKCLGDHLFVEVDTPPAGVGYGFHMYGPDGSGLWLRSGHEISGLGSKSKLLRVGRWRKGGRCFENQDSINGNSSIKLNNIYIDGFRGKPDVPDRDSNADSVGIAMRALADDKWCSDIEFTKVQIHNWPGVAIRIRDGSRVHYTDVKSVNPSRGGIIFNTSQDIHLMRVTSADSGDDAIAFYVTGYDSSDPRTYRPTRRIAMDSCASYTRGNAEFGAAVKFAGAWDAQVTNCTFRHSKNSLVFFRTFPGGFNPRDISVNDCRMLQGQRCSFHIQADRATGISARRNYMDRPSRDCVRIESLTGAARVFDVTIADNILVKPGSGTYFDVQENISGVRTPGNIRLRSPDTARPTIGKLSPAPRSKIRDRTPTIRATVKDNATNLSKRNIKLYVAGSAVPASEFAYNRSRNLLTYTPPRLSYGEKTVRIVATDTTGNTASKTWRFNVVRR